MKLIKHHYVLALVSISLVVSLWVYWHNNLKIKYLLTQNEWQGSLLIFINPNKTQNQIGPLHKIQAISNVKYLAHNEYIRHISLYLSSDKNTPPYMIKISERGQWSINNNYLIITPIEFNSLANGQSAVFSQDQIKLIIQRFRLDAEESRRVEMINKQTLLLTSLSHDPITLSASSPISN